METCFLFQTTYPKGNVKDTMSGKPFQSSLIPYQSEIATLRSSRPPVSYARISEILRQKYGLTIQRAGIAKFVKARSGGRKVYFFLKEVAHKKRAAVQTAQAGVKPAQAGHDPQVIRPNAEQQPPKPKFEFTYSERYNLHRLPPEEAARRRKELEAQGH
ncbi:MAG: hypothetical protein ABSC02_06265 [Acidobacteriota bacterium]